MDEQTTLAGERISIEVDGRDLGDIAKRVTLSDDGIDVRLKATSLTAVTTVDDMGRGGWTIKVRTDG